MSLTLDSITFNHDPLSSARSALNIRRNKDFEVMLPEWPLPPGAMPRERPAAYSMSDTYKQNVIVKATVSASVAGDYEIRATGGGVLGEIETPAVSIAGGATVIVDVPLSRRRFNNVGRHDVQWQWSYRAVGAGNWTNLATTEHRIYITLAAPKAPWTQMAASPYLPWADLLDYVCLAAGGSAQNSGVAIARTLVWEIYDSLNLHYDVVTAGSVRYGFTVTGDQFQLSEWIEYALNNQPPSATVCDPESGMHPLDQTVGCYDTAASLALMCAIVGADVRYQLHEPFGYLNPCYPIGRPLANNPHYFPSCISQRPLVGGDVGRASFLNHTYTTDTNGLVFDACLRAEVSFCAYVIYMVVAIIWALVLRLDLAYKYWDLAHGGVTLRLQQDYETTFIDVSALFEAAEAGGSPVPQMVDFSTM